jgi:uncharacterized LabA/DUF88 family protein
MNVAYVDGQNLYMGTAKCDTPWVVDMQRLRVYLGRKYSITTAYYYLGYVQEGAHAAKLYEHIQAAGFILAFRQHTAHMLGKKKGNVDSDIIFAAMKKVHETGFNGKIVLVTGDGDYKMLVDYLLERKQFAKLLFPNRKYVSSLYKPLGSEYLSGLTDPGVKEKIETKEKGSLGS